MPKNNQEESHTEVQQLVYFAAERTLMSWIRVSLGLMALGFVVDRLELILRYSQGMPTRDVNTNYMSVWGGSGLVLLGVAAALVAAVRYLRFSIYYHREGSTDPRHGILVGVILCVVIGLAGVGLAVALLEVFH